MFEARIQEGATLKKVVEAIKDLVENGNLECSDKGITLQAMDSSHVSLVALQLKSEGFDNYRCDRNISLGLNMVGWRLQYSYSYHAATPRYLSVLTDFTCRPPWARS